MPAHAPPAPRALRVPPGPRGLLLLGKLLEFGRDILDFQVRCRAEYGDVVRITLGTRVVYLVNDPALIHSVLVTQHRDFVKHSYFWRHVRAIFGNGLLTSEGDEWLRRRRLMAPAFHRERIASYADTMVSYTSRMLDGWQDGDTRNIHQDLMGVTLEIVAKVLFDTDVASEVSAVGSAFDTVTDEIAVRFRRPYRIPDWVPLPGNRRYLAGVRALDALVYRMIAEHRANGAQGTDLLSMLMQTRDADGTALTDREVRDDAVTLLLAGHETTALALSWAVHLLLASPAAERALHAELDEVLGGRVPDVSDLSRLRYTESVILESMRLYPPAYTFGREAVRDVELGDYRVPKGTTVFISPWVMHHDEQWFEGAYAFRPERWLDGLADRLPKHVYMPFGGGPRICIGNNFALMEAVLLLATVAQRFDFEPVAGHTTTPFATITLRPRGGVWARVRKRALK